MLSPLRLVRALLVADSGCISLLSDPSTVACDYLQISSHRFHNRGLHLDFEVLQWSKLIENGVRVHIVRQKTTPNGTFALRLRTATTHHKQLQPTKLRHTPHGVCEVVG